MFKGSLKEKAIFEVIQLLQASNQTGVLLITKLTKLSSLYLKKGVMVHAQVGEDTGIDALKKMCGALDADFAFEQGVEATGDSLIKFDSQKLLVQIRKRAIMLKTMAAHIPLASDIPSYNSENVPDDFEATPEELRLIILANGKLSVLEISEKIDIPVVKATKIFGRFAYHGLVSFNKKAEEVAKIKIEEVETSTAPKVKPRYWRGKKIN